MRGQGERRRRNRYWPGSSPRRGEQQPSRSMPGGMLRMPMAPTPSSRRARARCPDRSWSGHVASAGRACRTRRCPRRTSRTRTRSSPCLLRFVSPPAGRSGSPERPPGQDACCTTQAGHDPAVPVAAPGRPTMRGWERKESFAERKFSGWGSGIHRPGSATAAGSSRAGTWPPPARVGDRHGRHGSKTGSENRSAVPVEAGTQALLLIAGGRHMLEHARNVAGWSDNGRCSKRQVPRRPSAITERHERGRGAS